MPNTSVGTLKAQVGSLDRECARLQLVIDGLNQKIRELEDDHQTFVNEVLQFAPECMDGDASGESIAIDYVRSLEGEGGGMTGHREDCNCFE